MSSKKKVEVKKVEVKKVEVKKVEVSKFVKQPIAEIMGSPGERTVIIYKGALKNELFSFNGRKFRDGSRYNIGAGGEKGELHKKFLEGFKITGEVTEFAKI